MEQSGAPHLPRDEAHSLHFTLDTVHHGLLGFHTTPQSHLKETSISQRWDIVSCAPNKDHTLVGALKSPPCCIHLYGSAVVIQTIWGAEWICRDPWKKARPPTAIAHYSPSLPPRSGSIPSVPWGSPPKKRTSFTKTQIRQHMLPSSPPPNDQKGAWKNSDRQMGRLTLLCRRTSQCRRWTSAERGAVQMFWSDMMIVHISLLSTLLILFFFSAEHVSPSARHARHILYIYPQPFSDFSLAWLWLSVFGQRGLQTWMCLISSGIVVFIELDTLLKGRPPSLLLFPSSLGVIVTAAVERNSSIRWQTINKMWYDRVGEANDFINSRAAHIFSNLI